MSSIATARLMLTQCWKCLGCGRLEDLLFRGDKDCEYFRSAQQGLLETQK